MSRPLPLSVTNIFTPLTPRPSSEVFEVLAQNPGCRLERIVSTGQTTPADEWYDQPWDEWVVLLKGAARLRCEGADTDLELHPGDSVTIPAHCRHRVTWTPPEQQTIWLALHFDCA